MDAEFLLYHAALLGIVILLTQSLNVIWRSDRLSLGHHGYYGLGAYTAVVITKLALAAGRPWSPASIAERLSGVGLMVGSLIAAAVVAGTAGWLTARLFTRIRDDYFAVGTLIIAEIVPNVAANVDYVGGGLGFEGPYLFLRNEGPERLAYVAFYAATTIGLNVVLYLGIRRLGGSVFGLCLDASTNDELAAAFAGVDAAAIRRVAFTAGTAVAGAAEALFFQFMTIIVPGDFRFLNGLPIILYVVLGRLNVARCIIAAAVFYTIYELIKFPFIGVLGPAVGQSLSDWAEAVLASTLIAAVVGPRVLQALRRWDVARWARQRLVALGQARLPWDRARPFRPLALTGLGWLRNWGGSPFGSFWRSRLVWRGRVRWKLAARKARKARTAVARRVRRWYGVRWVRWSLWWLMARPWRGRAHRPTPEPLATRGTTVGETLLAIEALSRSFGGLQAVSKVTFGIRAGEVVGVIGPNGSGKTTLLNLITGIYRPTGGKVRFAGCDLVGLPPYRIARMGVARTFQTPRMFASLSVLEHAMVAVSPPGPSPGLSTLRSTLVRSRRLSQRGRAALESIGLGCECAREAVSLPHGKRRLLEIARGLAGGPRLLLLDEPAAGLNDAESEQLRLALDRVIKAGGLTVLVIEHNLTFVRNLCPRLLVMDQGELLRDGETRSVLSDPQVIASYLGGS